MNPELASLAPDQKRALLAEVLQQRASRPRQAPLSKGQERIWRLLELEPESAVYNLGFAYDLKGPLHVGALERALDVLTRRHEALRTTFARIEGVPMQVIAPEIGVRFERVDLGSIAEADFPAEAHRIAVEAARARIDLTASPSWRFTLIARSESDHVLLVNTHHIVSDRWSVGLLMQDLAAEYTALVRGEPSALTRPAGSYREAIRQIESSIPEPEVAEHLAYWRAQFGGKVQDLVLPTDLRPAGVASYRGMRRTFTLTGDLTTKLDALAAAKGTTVYVVLLAALAAHLNRETGQTDMVFLAPVSGRHHTASRGVIGYFNNLLPIRLSIVPRSGFRDLLRAAAQVVKGAFEHQDVPFQQIAELPGLNQTRLSRCFVSVQNTTSMDLDLPGIASSYQDVPTETANFDLAVFMEEHAGTYRGCVNAKTDLWSPVALDQYLQRFLAFLETLADRPEQPVGDLREETMAGTSPPRPERDGSPMPRATAIEPLAKGPEERVRNELERQMIGIWEDMMGLRPLGPDSHFFALGGHSLLAARIIDRIGRTIGREIPLAALLRAPTIRQLSNLILQEGDVPCWADLVPVQPHGERPPLFCVHGGGGGVLSYIHIAGHLGPDQPLWGLQAPRPEGNLAPPRVEDMADRYIQAILSVQSEGPYHLCGHSFGGLVAFEIARQLTGRGKSVALLVLIDYPGPDARIALLDKLRWFTYSVAQLELRQKVPYVLERVRYRVRSNPRLYRGLMRAFGWFGVKVDPSKTEYRLRTMSETMTAMQLYRPGPYQGRVTLFRARRGDAAINTDPHGGWGRTARGGVEIHDFACDHMDMFKEPHCGAVSRAIGHCLDRAQRPFEEVRAATKPTGEQAASSI